MTKLIVGLNDLSTIKPLIAAEWHPTLNGELTPQQVHSGSPSKTYWLGAKCGHPWKASIKSRVRLGSGCAVCSGKQVLEGFNDLATISPLITLEWHPVLNGELTPQQVHSGSSTKAHWLGKECGHSWKASIASRVRLGRDCPVCSGQQVLEGFNDLASAKPIIAAEWHPVLNGELTPQQVHSGSPAKVHWLGSACGHTWKTVIRDRVRKGCGCPYCSGKQVLAGFNDLATISSLIAAEWHPTLNGELTPQQVVAGSNKKAHWLGAKCGHPWKASIANRVGLGYGCPVCSGKQVLAGFNDLATISSFIAAEWHPTLNGDLTPEDFTVGVVTKVYWLGAKCGHPWKASIASRVRLGSGCPTCPIGKQERFFVLAFSEISGCEFSNTQLTGLPRVLRKRNTIQIDGISHDLKLIIEFDGEWTHGRENPSGESYKLKLARDADTTETLLNAGYKIIRIREQHPTRSLDFVQVNPENLIGPSLVSNLYQVKFKGNSFPLKNRDVIDDVVKEIIESKSEWFKK